MSSKKPKARITKDKILSLTYTLKSADGNTLETTSKHEPLTYMHGRQQIIRGVERALTGRRTGEKISLTVQPEDGYGYRDETLILDISESELTAHVSGDEPLAPGRTLYIERDKMRLPALVLEVSDGKVKVDANHSLAGKILFFEIEILDIRSASKEELAHGHAHTGSKCGG